MAWEKPLFSLSLEAAGDLSAKQFYFMKLDSSGRVTTCTAATDVPIGVLQNKPDALAKTAEIMAVGVSKISADAALATPGTLIGTSADGQADAKTVAVDTTEYVVGQTVGTASAAADLVSCAINCLNPHRAA